jgi:hypothetical protein
MAYSTQRGYGRNHPFVGELGSGPCRWRWTSPSWAFPSRLGEVVLTECETVNQFTGSKTEPPQFTRGYGLVFGQTERKAISMALVDRALRWEELGEDNVGAPAQDAEFVLYHSDNVQATGFLEHIKLPHYVDFQSELELIRRLRAEAMAGHAGRPRNEPSRRPRRPSNHRPRRRLSLWSRKPRSRRTSRRLAVGPDRDDRGASEKQGAKTPDGHMIQGRSCRVSFDAQDLPAAAKVARLA